MLLGSFASLLLACVGAGWGFVRFFLLKKQET